MKWLLLKSSSSQVWVSHARQVVAGCPMVAVWPDPSSSPSKFKTALERTLHPAPCLFISLRDNKDWILSILLWSPNNSQWGHLFLTTIGALLSLRGLIIFIGFFFLLDSGFACKSGLFLKFIERSVLSAHCPSPWIYISTEGASLRMRYIDDEEEDIYGW